MSASSVIYHTDHFVLVDFSNHVKTILRGDVGCFSGADKLVFDHPVRLEGKDEFAVQCFLDRIES